jgi:hypothetical protein
MSDDLNNKIQQIADVLGKESMPDNVKELLALLAGSLGSKEAASDKPGRELPAEESVKKQPESEDNTEMFRKVKKVLDKLNTGNDPRMNLLYAIKPFMNNRRQKKLSNCIQLLQMTSLSRLLNDHEK